MRIPITFLGTGQAIPTAKRNHPAILLKYKSETILFDCGEGTQRQFKKKKKNMCKVGKLLITHWHGDHILGIPGFLQSLQLSKCPRTLEIYGPKKTKTFIKILTKLFMIKNKKIKTKELNKGKVLETKDFYIETVPMKHGAPFLAYSFIEKDKIRLDKNKIKKLKIKGKILAKLAHGKNITWKGKKIKAKNLIYKQKGKKITIILDTIINPNCYKIAKNSDLLICEAVYSEKEKNLAREYKHLTASQAAQIAKKAKVEKLILTHLSQRYNKSEFKILGEAKKIFKNSELAEDLDVLEI